MFNKLLPFTLIASFALPFIAKADELPVAVEQPKPTAPGLSKEQTDFMTLVASAVYIERYQSQECTDKIVAFLNAVRKEVSTEKNFLSLIFASRKLDAQRIAHLQEDLDEVTQTLLARYKENGKHLIVIGVALAAPAMPGKRFNNA